MLEKAKKDLERAKAKGKYKSLEEESALKNVKML